MRLIELVTRFYLFFQESAVDAAPALPLGDAVTLGLSPLNAGPSALNHTKTPQPAPCRGVSGKHSVPANTVVHPSSSSASCGGHVSPSFLPGMSSYCSQDFDDDDDDDDVAGRHALAGSGVVHVAQARPASFNDRVDLPPIHTSSSSLSTTLPPWRIRPESTLKGPLPAPAPVPPSVGPQPSSPVLEPPAPGLEEEDTPDPGLPPEDTRSIIDKLAAFVARNGVVFEATVMRKERGNPRFAFLLPWNPHHAYYQRKLEDLGFRRELPAMAPSPGEEKAETSEQPTEQRTVMPRPPITLTFAHASVPPTVGSTLTSVFGPDPLIAPPGLAPDAMSGAAPEQAPELDASVSIEEAKIQPVVHLAVGPSGSTGQCDSTGQSGPSGSAGASVSSIKPNPQFLAPAASVSQSKSNSEAAPGLEDGPQSALPRSLPLNVLTLSHPSEQPEVSATSTAPVASTTLSGFSGVQDPDQILAQRRERARVLLLRRQEEAKRRDGQVIRTAVLGHRQALLSALRGGESGGEDEGGRASSLGEEEDASMGGSKVLGGETNGPRGEIKVLASILDQGGSPDMDLSSQIDLKAPADVQLDFMLDGHGSNLHFPLDVANKSRQQPPNTALPVVTSIAAGGSVMTNLGDASLDSLDDRSHRKKKKANKSRSRWAKLPLFPIGMIGIVDVP